LHSREAGISNKKFLEDLVNGKYGWQVQDDLKEGIDRGVKGVPTFFINEEPLTGKPSFENLSKMIDAALKIAKRKTPERKRA
jgi:protein-disulfide isomerase